MRIIPLLIIHAILAVNISFSQTNNFKIFAPGVISTGDRETGITFTPDGKKAYFTKWAPDFSLAVICESIKVNGVWQKPTIAPFSGQYKDQHPFISPDGEKLYFISQRPLQDSGSKKDYDIWMVSSTQSGWSEPVNLGPKVNSISNEYSPSVTASGKLYFASDWFESKGGSDFYYCEIDGNEYLERVRIENPEINSSFQEWHIYVSSDDKKMFYTSLNRTGGKGDEDLYYAAKESNKWVHQGAFHLNTPMHDYLASISPDGQTFYFTSVINKPVNFDKKHSYKEFTDRIHGPQNGQPDIYYMSVSEVLQNIVK